jgi:hypothetical protein
MVKNKWQDSQSSDIHVKKFNLSLPPNYFQSTGNPRVATDHLHPQVMESEKYILVHHSLSSTSAFAVGSHSTGQSRYMNAF